VCVCVYLCRERPAKPQVLVKPPCQQHTAVWFAQNHSLILHLRTGSSVKNAKNGHMNFVLVDILVTDMFAIFVISLLRLHSRM